MLVNNFMNNNSYDHGLNLLDQKIPTTKFLSKTNSTKIAKKSGSQSSVHRSTKSLKNTNKKARQSSKIKPSSSVITMSGALLRKKSSYEDACRTLDVNSSQRGSTEGLKYRMSSLDVDSDYLGGLDVQNSIFISKKKRMQLE